MHPEHLSVAAAAAAVGMHCSANDVGLAATVTNTLDPTLMAGASSFKAMGRQGQVATAIHKGSKHPESVTGHSVAGTAISAAVTAIGRPGSAAKSQMTAVSGASAARSKASAATAASVGAMMAKDKLSQVRATSLITGGSNTLGTALSTCTDAICLVRRLYSHSISTESNLARQPTLIRSYCQQHTSSLLAFPCSCLLPFQQISGLTAKLSA